MSISVEMCRYARTCHGIGCSTVLEHLAFCGWSSGFVCIEKCEARLRKSLFNHQRFVYNV